MHPGWIAVRLVQAAVAARAAQIRFSLGARELVAKIYFSEVMEPTQPVQDYLGFAVQLALAGNPRRLEWQCQEQNLDLKSTIPPLRAQGLATFTLERSGWLLWQQLNALLTARSDIHHLLHQRACLAPVPVYLDAARINASWTLSDWGPHHGLRLAPLEAAPCHKLLGPTPGRVRADRFYFGEESMICDLTPRDRGLISYFLEGATEPEFRYIEAREDQRRLPEVSQAGALPLCHGGIWKTVGDNSIFLVKQQWEWLNPRNYLSAATAVKGSPASLLADRWFQFDPNSPRPSELWPVRDGVLLEPVPLSQAPSGCRVVAALPELPLAEDARSLARCDALTRQEGQLAEDISWFYQALRLD